MTLNRLRIQRWTLQGIDAALACAAVILAFFMRQALAEWLPFDLRGVGELSDYMIFWPLLLAATPLVLQWIGYYQLGSLEKLSPSLNLSLQAALMLFLAMVCFQFALNLQMSRLVLVFFIPLYTLVLMVRTRAYGVWLRQRGRHRVGSRNVVVVSDAGSKGNWQEVLHLENQLGFKIVRELDLASLPLEVFISTLHDESVELVIFDIKITPMDRLNEAIRACEDEGIEAWLSVDFLEIRYARARFINLGRRPLLVFSRAPENSFELLIKEVMDRVGAAVALILLSPFLVVVALLVKLTSPGPILFRQERSGLAGRPFTMLKFRSMVTNAEQLRDELVHLNEMTGPVFKITKDPRITPLGRWLRRTSVDELPQLFNVLKGEMSLVGPRPLPVYETRAISQNEHRRRLSMKPGLTCLWQISGRNNVPDFAEWVRLDLEYIDNWSIWLDVEILLKTIPVLLFGKGAK